MNRYRWLAAGLILVFAGCLAATLLLLASNTSEDNAVNRALQAIAALAALGSFIFGVLGKKTQDSDTKYPDLGMSLANAPSVRVAIGERSHEVSFKSYLRLMERRMIDLGMNQSSFVPLTMIKGPAVGQAATPQFLPDLEWMNRHTGEQYVNAEPEKINLLDIPGRFDQTVLLGEPGSGKTTCLQRLTLDVLENASAWLSVKESASSSADGDYPQLPLYASLSQWQQGTRAIEFLRTQLQNLLGPENYYVIHFEALLADGRFILILDGLNELPGRRANPSEGRHEQRQEPGHGSFIPEMGAASIDRREIELRELASSIGLQSKFILTCRSHEYFDSHRWQTVRILPMNPEQIGRFVSSYLDPQTAAGLQSSLDSDDKLATIANNPFFLRALITIYRPGLQFTSRGQILAYLYKILLQRERERGTAMPPEPVLTATVGRASYEMLADGKVGSNAVVDGRDNARRAYLRILAGTGLVLERDDSFFFLHQIIQEFFAAMALNARAVRRNPKALLADKRWSEVIALWCDVDSDRMPDRVIAALRARNMPWRRPRSYQPPLLSSYQVLVWLTAVIVVANYFWNWVLGSPHLLGFPVHLFGLAALAFAALAIVIRQLSFCTIRHHKITTNSTYVLSQIRCFQALDDIISSLSKLLYIEAEEVAPYVARAFGVMALPQVTNGLGHRNWRVRLGCVLILGEIARSSPDDRRALEYLLAVAGADDPQLMRALIEALGGCRDDRIPRALGQLLSSTRMNPVTLGFRLSPLSKLGSENDALWSDDAIARFDELVRKDRHPLLRSAAFQVMGALRIPECETRLGTVAADPNEHSVARQGAIKGLGMAQTPGAVECLVQVAEQRSEVRKWASQALQQIKNPATIPVLAQAAKCSRWEVRQAAAVALGATGRPEAFEPLELLAEDYHFTVKETVARALSLIDLPAAVPVLGRLARDRNSQVRKAALEALNSRYPHLASTELVALAEEDHYSDRVRVIRSLGRHADPAIEEKLNDLLASPDKDVRDAASEALRTLRASVGKRKRVSRQLDLFGKAKARVANWLQLDGFQQLLREERMAGVPENMVASSVIARIFNDAELTRRYRLLFRIYFVALMAVAVFGLFTLVLVFRFSIWSARGMLDEWPYFVGLLVLAVISFIPWLTYFDNSRLVDLLRLLAAAVAVVGLLGGILYGWWIVVSATVIAGLLIVLISTRRRRRRRRDVQGALRLAHAAVSVTT